MSRRLTHHHLDVSDRNAVHAFPAEVLAEHPGVDILVNNAGVALGGTFDQVSEEDFDWLLSINLFGVVRMTRAFLPLLHKSDDARLVNLSSIFGVVTPPGQTAYCASKFAVRGFTEALMHELEGTAVGVTCVHPGGINTPISRNSRLGESASAAVRDTSVALFEKRLARTTPATAAARIVAGVKREEPRILIGKDAIQLERLQRLFPVRYWQIMMRNLKKAAAHGGFQTAAQKSAR